jgi:hypothetical protein
MKSTQIKSPNSSVNSSSIPTFTKGLVSDQNARSMASNIFQQLKDQGYRPRDIITVSSQLIDLITEQIGKESR